MRLYHSCCDIGQDRICLGLKDRSINILFILCISPVPFQRLEIIAI